MLAYYLNGDNVFTIRTQPTGSSNLYFGLQNMYTLTNQSSSISYTYNDYEGILQFTASINGAEVGNEYRAWVSNGTCDIWNGSVQVYTSQSIDKPNYVNQLPLEEVFKSNVTDNEYIILT